MQGFGSRSDSASKSLAHASSVADALNQRFASLTQRVLSVYAAYKLLDGVVAATNVGIQANTAWESQKLSIASIIFSTNSLADAQGRILEGSEKFIASQQIAEKLMQRLQQLGLETTATTQELVNGFQAIIAPALKAGYALEEIPELATRAAQAMGAFQIPIQQMRTEVEALLSGNINKAQDLLAPYLNISKKLVKEWKAQGVLVEEINKRLESFKYSGDAIANTWEGLTSNAKEYVEYISRGSTDGLFNSMKASVRELQSLMITMNQKTGLAEVSSKVNNITAAWERMNDFIGNKVLVATMKFADWIEELNRPENLAELERQVETLWNDFSGIASTAWEVAKAAGKIGKTALDGFNSLPQWAQEIGIIGGLFFGIRGKLAVAGIAYLVEISKNLDSSLSKLQSMGGNESLAYNAYGDFTQEYEASQEKIRTTSSSTADSVKNDLNSVANTAAYVIQRIGDSIRSGLEAQMKAISAEIEAQRKIYEEFSEFAYSNQIEDYPAAQESAFQKAKDARQKMESLNESLENVTYQLSILSENAFSAAQYVESIGWGVVSLNEHQPTQLNAAIADLRLTAGTFNLNLLETKNRIDAINGSKAVVEFEIQYNGQQAPKDVFERVWGEGNSSVNDWLSGTLNLLDNIYGKITATASLGKTAADDGKKKAKQIESALHSVESELNRLQMTDAQYKQWQVDEKVEKLEKLLGSTNPKVIELRTSLQKELNDNLFKDVLKFANPAAAAVATVEKEYDDWKKNLEQLKKQAPDKYAKLMAENINLMANAQRQYNNALEQAKSTFINFRKETVDIYAQSTMTDEEYFVYQNNRQIEEWEKQGQSRADIDERVNALLLQRNNKYSADFGKMWERRTTASIKLARTCSKTSSVVPKTLLIRSRKVHPHAG